jgi:kynurenine formamidase
VLFLNKGDYGPSSVVRILSSAVSLTRRAQEAASLQADAVVVLRERALACEDAEQGAQEQPGIDVEAGTRLVEHEQLGVVQEHGRDEHALAHALGERRHRAIAVVQLEQLEKLWNPSPERSRQPTRQSAAPLSVHDMRDGIQLDYLHVKLITRYANTV